MVVLEFKFGTYEGEVDENGLRHGKGNLTYKNGNVVEGDWVHGAFTGSGTKTFSNGDIYKGDFFEGKKHGKGVYTFARGGTYTGEYVDDIQHGEGLWQSDTESYQGSYEKGKRCGHGVETLTSAQQVTTIYSGEWQDSKRHGQGKLTLDNGVYWEGRWADGRKVEAEGKLYEADGTEVTDTPSTASKAENGIPDLSTLSQQPEMQSLLAALSQQGDNPDMAALQQTLLQTCKGMESFGANITNGLSKASSGLDALEGQLEELTNVLGLEDEAAMNDQIAAATAAIKQQQDDGQEPGQEPVPTATAECGTSPIEDLDDDDESTAEPDAPKTVQDAPPSAEEHADFLDRIDLLNNKLLSQVLAAEAELENIRRENP